MKRTVVVTKEALQKALGGGELLIFEKTAMIGVNSIKKCAHFPLSVEVEIEEPNPNHISSDYCENEPLAVPFDTIPSKEVYGQKDLTQLTLKRLTNMIVNLDQKHSQEISQLSDEVRKISLYPHSHHISPNTGIWEENGQYVAFCNCCSEMIGFKKIENPLK